MENYKSYCLDCKATYSWSGYKTGLGKTPAQLLQMSQKDHTCRQCNSKLLKTGLDHFGNPPYPNYQEVDQVDYSILTEFEKEWARDKLSWIPTESYNCKHCKGNYFTPITTWKDQDGEWVILYCMDCKHRVVIKDDYSDLCRDPVKKEEPEVDATPNQDPVYLVIQVGGNVRDYTMDKLKDAANFIKFGIEEFEGWKYTKMDALGLTNETLQKKITEEVERAACSNYTLEPLIVYNSETNVTRIACVPLKESGGNLKSFTITLLVRKGKYHRGDLVRFTRKATDKFPEVVDIGQIISINYGYVASGGKAEYSLMTSAHANSRDWYRCEEADIIELIQRSQVE